MQKQEFLELFETATQAAKSAKGSVDENSPEVSRCIEAMKRLKEAPESLACHLVYTTSSIGKSNLVFSDHENDRIRSEAKLLWDLWLTYFYATGRERSGCDRVDQIPVKRVKSSMMKKTGDPNREKVRELLQKSLSKVAAEVVDTEMKKRVVSCDPTIVAASVESAMFEKFGCFAGPQKLKYRSILFNMGDSNNQDLRRKVLIGEISGKRLVMMEKEEMGSDKIQMEVQRIKEKARLREDNRLKMILQSDMIMT